MGDAAAAVDIDGEHTHPTGGRGFADDEAALVAGVAEAVERYASIINRGLDARWATAADLGEDALDLDALPRVSSTEHALAGCPYIQPDTSARIRWVPAVELTSGATRWVPAVTASLGARPVVPEEAFWVSVSTGFAAHTSMTAALVNALLEVVERDSSAVLWQQMLSIPAVEPSTVAALDPAIGEVIGWLEDHFVDVSLLDATTDLGIPVCCAVLWADRSDAAAHAVGSGAAATMLGAVASAFGESACLHTGLARRLGVQRTPDDFRDVQDGPVHMGRPDQRSAFEFLRSPQRGPRQTALDLPSEPRALLAALVDVFRRRDEPVYAVDLTTSDVRAAGCAAVRVVVPSLQPLTMQPFVHLRGHRRLYDAPAAMGYVARAESELNPAPPPFG